MRSSHENSFRRRSPGSGRGPCGRGRPAARQPGITRRLVPGRPRVVEAADKDIDSLHSFMLVRHGHVVAEGWWAPYAAESPHMLFSLSKSFTSTAVGIAAAEGKLSVD